MKIILGSSSKYRKELLKSMGYEFEVISPDIDEKAIRHTDPQQLTLAIANAKADAVLKKLTAPAIIIASDQVVTWNDQIREKPLDETEARYFLNSSSEAPVCTVSAIVVVNSETKQRYSGVDIAKIWFSTIPEKVIDTLIKEGEVYHCAGGFTHEHPIIQDYIIKMEGTTDSISGLPKKLTNELINKALN